jgi:hypothetical protein
MRMIDNASAVAVSSTVIVMAIADATALYECIDLCMAAFRHRITQRQTGRPTQGNSGVHRVGLSEICDA